MAERNRPVHLIVYRVHYGAYAVCDMFLEVVPIEATTKKHTGHNDLEGTFNPKKVTCKRCLKHPDYKETLDKVKNPLFYWRENTV